MNEESTEIIKLTNREFACILWNTVYPERRPFKELDESTKKMGTLGQRCKRHRTYRRTQRTQRN